MTVNAAQIYSGLSRLGPFIGHEPLSTVPGNECWRRLCDVISSDAWVEQWIEHTRTALAEANAISISDVEKRVASSTAHLSLIARIISPTVALVALTGRTPDLGRHLWLCIDSHRLLAATDYEGLASDRAWELANDDLVEPLIRRLLLPFGERIEQVSGLSRAIVTGNTASALRGAATVLRSAADPEVGRRATELVAGLLDLPELSSAWHVHPGPKSTWRRRSCCLFYRMPGGALCGDCALTHMPGDDKALRL